MKKKFNWKKALMKASTVPQLIFVLVGILLVAVGIIGMLNANGIKTAFFVKGVTVPAAIAIFVLAAMCIVVPIVWFIIDMRKINLWTEGNKKSKKSKTKKRSKAKQNLFKKPLVLTIVMSLGILFTLSIAAICFADTLLPEPFLTSYENGVLIKERDSWRLGTFALCMAIPLIFILVNNTIKTYKRRKNQPAQDSIFFRYCFAFAIFIPLLAGPFLFIKTWARFKSVWPICYLSLFAIIILLVLSDFLYVLIRTLINKFVLKSKNSIRGKGTYVGCKYKSSTGISINGIFNNMNLTFNLVFSFINEKGVKITKKTIEEYSIYDIACFKYKGEFDILYYKNNAVIVEDFSNFEPSEKAIIKESKQLELKTLKKRPLWLILFILGLSVFTVAETIGISLLAFSKGINKEGYYCVAGGLAVLGATLIYALPSVLAEYKGKETTGTLLSLEAGHAIGKSNSGYRKMYAIVKINNDVKQILIPSTTWFGILQGFVGKEIPLKVYKRTAIININQLFSNLL